MATRRKSRVLAGQPTLSEFIEKRCSNSQSDAGDSLSQSDSLPHVDLNLDGFGRSLTAQDEELLMGSIGLDQDSGDSSSTFTPADADVDSQTAKDRAAKMTLALLDQNIVHSPTLTPRKGPTVITDGPACVPWQSTLEDLPIDVLQHASESQILDGAYWAAESMEDPACVIAALSKHKKGVAVVVGSTDSALDSDSSDPLNLFEGLEPASKQCVASPDYRALQTCPASLETQGVLPAPLIASIPRPLGANSDRHLPVNVATVRLFDEAVARDLNETGHVPREFQPSSDPSRVSSASGRASAMQPATQSRLENAGTTRPSGGKGFRRKLPKNVSGGPLGRDDILAYAAQYPLADPLLSDESQIRILKDERKAAIGVGVRVGEGGKGIICFWFREQKATISHVDRETAIGWLQDWTLEWPEDSGAKGKGKGKTIAKGKQRKTKKHDLPDDMPSLRELKSRRLVL